MREGYYFDTIIGDMPSPRSRRHVSALLIVGISVCIGAGRRSHIRRHDSRRHLAAAQKRERLESLAISDARCSTGPPQHTAPRLDFTKIGDRRLKKTGLHIPRRMIFYHQRAMNAAPLQNALPRILPSRPASYNEFHRAHIIILIR